jgi:hypothetical protein
MEMVKVQQSLWYLPNCTVLYSTLYLCEVHAVQSEIPIQCISADQGFSSVFFNNAVYY